MNVSSESLELTSKTCNNRWARICMDGPNEIRVSLTLTSKNHFPEEVTAATGLRPAKAWRINDLIEGTLRPYEYNGWSLASGLESSAELEEHLSALLTNIEPVVPMLRELSGHWDIEVSCSIYAKAYVPSCHFGKETIQRFASIGAQIDVDFYCWLHPENLR
jgi:hypothetical protein